MSYAFSGSPADRNYNTSGINLEKTTTDSKILVWQGYLWNRAIIATYGWRQDEQESRVYRRLRPESGELVFDDPMRFPSSPNVELPSYENYEIFKSDGQTTNWSIAAHLHELIGDPWTNNIPFNLSLYYNEGENFNPTASRTDANGKQFPSPKGDTTDISFLLATKDNKYSVRVTKYATSIVNATSSAGLGEVFRFAEFLYQPAQEAAQYLSGAYDSATQTGAQRRKTTFGGRNFPMWDGSPYDPDKFQNVVLPDWQAFESELQEKFPGFVGAWLTDGSWNPSSLDTRFDAPIGFVATEDTVSEGVEIELTANPLPGWNIRLNVSKTEAVRRNVGGSAFLEIMQFALDRLEGSPAGDVPSVWMGAPPVVKHALFPRAQRVPNDLEIPDGVSQPEIREWRANLITNYSFRNGPLKGLGIGTGIRYEDAYAIDFQRDFSGDLPTIILDKPFMRDEHITIDLWTSYKFKVSEDIDCKVQLNVFNAFGEDELVPLSLNQNSDGVIVGPGNQRIRFGRSWEVRASFSF